MNPPKGIDPKVWEMAEMLVVSVEAMPSDGNIYNIAKAISRAIEAEREECAKLVIDKTAATGMTTAKERWVENIGIRLSQAIRSRSNTTTERNE